MTNDFNLGIGVTPIVNNKKLQNQIDAQSKNISLKLSVDSTDIQKQINNYAKIQKDALSSKYLSNSYTDFWEKAGEQIDKTSDKLRVVKTRAEASGKGFDSYLKSLKPSALTSYSKDISNITSLFNEAAKSGKQIDLSKANSQLGLFKSRMKDAGLETATFSQKIKENVSAFSNWYFIGGAVSSLVSDLKSAISTLKEVDTLLTEISKTSSLSGDALKELGSNAFDAASKYGNTVQSYLEGYKEMSRGTDTSTAQGLAEMSILAQSAGDMTAELANEYIIATNAAYKLNGEVSKINAVLDSQNQVSNKNQVSMSKLAEATKVAGSQAAASGVQVNELTAAVGTMAVVTQGSGEEVGRAFKGILMNLQGVYGETDDGDILDSESFTKVEKAASALGVSLKEVKDGVLQLRDPIEILKELSKAYSNLPQGDVAGANLISALGGKYRGNQLTALLTNWDTYEKILSDYQNASGSALSEAQKTADSLEGRLNKLSNTWNKTVSNVVDSDILKYFVSAGTSAIELADKMNLLKIALVEIGGLAIYKGFSALIPMLVNATSSTIAFGNALNIVKSSDFVVNSTNLSNALSGLNSEQMTAVLSTKALSSEINLMSTSQLTATLTNAGLSEAEATTVASTIALSTATGTATTTTLGFGASLKALGAAMLANPVGLAITGITLAVSALSFGLNTYKQNQEETIAKIKEDAASAKELSTELSDLSTQYKSLTEAVKTDASQKDSLISTQNELLEKLGLEGESIDSLIKKYGSLDEAINQTTMSKLKSAQGDLVAGVGEAADELTKSSEKLYKGFSNYTIMVGKSDLSSLNILKNAGLDITSSTKEGFGALMLDASNSVDGIINRYNQLKTAQEALVNSNKFSSEELSKNNLYKEISSMLGDLEPLVEDYNTSIENLNENLVNQQMVIALQGKELPDTAEEFEAFEQQLVNASIASGKFVGSEEDIRNSVTSFLSSVPEFSDFFTETASSTDAATTALSAYETAVNAIPDKLEELDDVQQKITDGQSLSYDEIQKLVETYPELESSIQRTSDGWTVEASAISTVRSEVMDLSTEYTNAQTAMNEIVANGVAARLEQYGIELDALNSVAEALSAINNQNVQNNYAYGTAPSSGYISSADTEKVTAYIEAKEKLEELQSKLTDLGNGSSISGSSSSSTDSTDEWKEAFDNELRDLKHNLAMKYISEQDYYKQLEVLYKKYFEGQSDYVDEYYQYMEEVNNGLLQLQEDNMSAIETLANLQVSVIKQEKEDAKSALEAVKDAEKGKLDAINEVIDARKKVLELTKDEEDYEKELSEKNTAVSKIQAELETLSADDSASATKRKLELEEQLTTAKAELDDYQAQHVYDTQQAQLDAEAEAAQASYDAKAEELDNQISLIDDYLSKQGQMFQDALNDISGMDSTVYQNMINWNAVYGDGISQNITNKWSEAYNALAQYSSALDAVSTYNSLKNASVTSTVVPSSTSAIQSATVTSSYGSSSSGASSDMFSYSKYYGNKSTLNTDSSVVDWLKSRDYDSSLSARASIYSALGGSGTFTGTSSQNSWLLKKLKESGFKTGNNEIKSITSALGEDGIAFVKKGESIFNQENTQLIKDLVSLVNPMSDLVKTVVPNLSTTNNTSQPITITEGNIIINGGATQEALAQIQQIKDEWKKDVFNTIQYNKYKSGLSKPTF